VLFTEVLYTPKPDRRAESLGADRRLQGRLGCHKKMISEYMIEGVVEKDAFTSGLVWSVVEKMASPWGIEQYGSYCCLL
jgi:hypothetical protein